MLLIYLAIAWLSGILLGGRFEAPFWMVFLGLAPLPLAFFLRPHRKTIVVISLCLISLLGGAVRYQSNLPVINEASLQYYNSGEKVTVRGVVSAAPDERDKSTQLKLAAREIEINGIPHEVTGTVLLLVSKYPEYRYGDELEATGKLETPGAIEDFDYAGYLANQGIYSTMAFPQINVTGQGRGFVPLSWIYDVRRVLAQKMAEVLPEPQASLAQGIVLGMRGNIPLSVKGDFSITGTMHVLAISGMNLSIIAGLLVSLFTWRFGKRHYLYVWLTLGVVWVYSILTGMSPPVLRAVIMLTIFLLADVLGRQRNALPVLALTGAVMVGVTPLIMWDASFQLSFLAVLGLVIVAPALQARGKQIVTPILGEEGVMTRAVTWIADSLAVTLGVTLLVWPLIAHYFGVFSIVSPLATLLVSFALAPIIVTGILASTLGLIFIPLGQVVGWVAWLFLSYMLAVVGWLANIPSSAVRMGTIPAGLIWGYFVLAGAILWLLHHRVPFERLLSLTNKLASRIPTKLVVPVLLVTAILSTVIACSMSDDRLHVSFLDVGQGDAILIQTADHQDILIDGGPSPRDLNLELGKRLPFWDRTIELVVLTHPHADHLTGLVDVLKRYRVGQVLVPGLETDSPLWLEWTDLMTNKKIPGTTAVAGQIIKLGDGVEIEVVNPLPDSDISDMDNDVVLKITDGKISFLLTSDISQQIEMDLLTGRVNLDSTVLKVSHHGSEYSSSPAFLAAVDPDIAVISVGKDNDYGHPAADTVARLAEAVGKDDIFRTDNSGTIEFITDGERLWVKKDH